MISSLNAKKSGPIVVARNCPISATCRLTQDHHGVMVFDCRHLRRIRGRAEDGEVVVECYFERLRLICTVLERPRDYRDACQTCASCGVKIVAGSLCRACEDKELHRPLGPDLVSNCEVRKINSRGDNNHGSV